MLVLYPSLKSQLHKECKTSSLCHFSDDEDGALIMHLSDVFGCEPLFYFMDKVSMQESKRVLKNSESTYSSSFNMHRIMKEIFTLLYRKYLKYHKLPRRSVCQNGMSLRYLTKEELENVIFQKNISLPLPLCANVLWFIFG